MHQLYANAKTNNIIVPHPSSSNLGLERCSSGEGGGRAHQVGPGSSEFDDKKQIAIENDFEVVAQEQGFPWTACYLKK